MRESTASSTREVRRWAVIGAAREAPEFSLEFLKLKVGEEHTSFVTKTVRALQADGHLLQTQSDPDPAYRWLSDPSEFSTEVWLRSRSATRITSTPVSDRPRERLLAGGAATLRTAGACRYGTGPIVFGT